MNAVLTTSVRVSGNDVFQRNDALRRKNAESAYDRHVKYNGDNQKMLDELEALLMGKKERKVIEDDQQEIQQVGAGQVKQVAIQVGKTLEETIDSWKSVRSDAVSVPEPSTAEYLLAATAPSKIKQAEAVEGVFMDLPLGIDREALKMKKRFEQAISSYSFHVQMKQKGFEIEMPSFYKSA